MHPKYKKNVRKSKILRVFGGSSAVRRFSHMQRKLFILGSIIFLTLMLTIPCSSVITFERTYGGAEIDGGFSVQQTLDGGYIIAGCSGGLTDYDVYLIKTDSLGNVLWEKTFGDSLADWSYSVQQTVDDGYIIVGWTESFGVGLSDVYLIKTDSSGNLVWDKTYGDSLRDYGRSVRQTTDGGYIIAGDKGRDIYLVKTDSAGGVLWETTCGPGLIDQGSSVQQTLDGGYVVAGVTYSFPTWGDVCLIKTDSLGNTVWEASHGGSINDAGYSVQQSLDGGYIIVGVTESFGEGFFDIYLVKIDSLGNVLWDTTYGGSEDDRGRSVQQTVDDGYIIAGWTRSFGAGLNDVYLIKTDSLGNILWDRTYGGSSGENGYSVQQTSDGGYVITGLTFSFGSGGDVYLIKTDENGLVGVQESNGRLQIEGYRLMQNLPNPFSRSTVISYSLPLTCTVTLKVYDLTGKLVDTLVDRRQEPGVYKLRWKAAKKPNGVYFYRLQAEDFTDTKKMLLLR